MMKKSKREIELLLKEYLTSENPRLLYKAPFVNYSGVTSDTAELYSEIIAEHLFSGKQARNILEEHLVVHTRLKSSHIKTHDGTTTTSNSLCESNRLEEHTALAMFNHRYANIGTIIDYQVPLKNTQKDKGFGKIDLLAHNDEGLVLLELKNRKNKETLLRAVLEVYTYWRTIDKNKLLSDYNISSGYVTKGVLIYKNSLHHIQIQNPNISQLMRELDVKCYLIDGESPQNYEISLEA